MVFKRCVETGCQKAPRCKHRWYVHVEVNEIRERGPVQTYAHLLEEGQLLPVTQREAELLEAKVRVWVSRGRPAPTASAPADPVSTRTIAEACQAYRKGHVSRMSDKSAPSITKHIEAFAGTRPLADLLDIRLLREYVHDIAEERSPTTANRYLARWSHLITWCRAEYKGSFGGDSPLYHRLVNPKGVKKFDEGDGRKRRLDPAEETALIAAFEKLDDGGMMLGRFYCALDTGLRRGEMLRLTQRDVIRNYGGNGETVLRVRFENAKSKKTRYVPVSTNRLRTFLDGRRFVEFPFAQHDGTRLDEFHTVWQNALIAAGIDAGHYERRKTQNGESYGVWNVTKDGDLHWHDLRHECGSRLADRNTPVTEIQKLLGHASLAMTQRYLNPRFENLAANMRRVAVEMGL